MYWILRVRKGLLEVRGGRGKQELDSDVFIVSISEAFFFGHWVRGAHGISVPFLTTFGNYSTSAFLSLSKFIIRKGN